ncbi:MAG: hypothetical protein HQL65_07960 [Magnetococcales bacterium]|nr:hypothetical protein [Magnetococcales bacterium]
MWTDPIVEEVRKNREAYAAQFDFDLRAMGKALQEREAKSDRTMVSLADSKPGHVNKISQIDGTNSPY